MFKFMKKFFNERSNIKVYNKPCPNCRGILYLELINTIEYGWTDHVWCENCNFVANLEPEL